MRPGDLPPSPMEESPAPNSAQTETEEPGSSAVGALEATDGSHTTGASDHEPLSYMGAEEWLCVPVLHLCAGPCHRASTDCVRQECCPSLLHLQSGCWMFME
ncbi:sialidase-3 isoform X4 [Aotus nancymaae]|uniref:sialidase-3 isoform X4 n=1 Tax=Aotus nancymaae TaxID=37293 RepID=UPI0030FE499E